MSDIELPNHSGLFNIVKCIYGIQILQLLRTYIKTTKKISMTIIIFNQRCRRYHILPSYIQVRPLVKTREVYKIAKNCAFKVLSACIQQGYVTKKKLSQDLFFQQKQLEYLLKPSHLTTFTSYCKGLQDKEKSTCKIRQKKKFEKLLSHHDSSNQHSGRRWVINLSSSPLSTSQTSVLTKGLNFAVVPRSPPIPRIIANIEEALKSSKADPSTVSSARSRIIGTLNKPIRHNPNLSPDETKALKEFRSDNNIIILKSDKGSKCHCGNGSSRL